MIVGLHQDLEEMKIEVLLTKEEKIEGVLLVVTEMIVGLHQDLRKVIRKPLLMKKKDPMESLLDLKKNLAVIKKSHLINFQKNLVTYN